jgi:hypothetical protein
MGLNVKKIKDILLQCLWCLMSHTLFAKLDAWGSQEVSCQLIVIVILFVNISNFSSEGYIYIMTFSVAHWDIVIIILCLNMQEEDIIKHTNEKCHVSTF